MLKLGIIRKHRPDIDLRIWDIRKYCPSYGIVTITSVINACETARTELSKSGHFDHYGIPFFTPEFHDVAKDFQYAIDHLDLHPSERPKYSTTIK